MSVDNSNGVSTREHMEQIIARIEDSVKQQISGLREDIKHLQNNYITRHEHESTVQHMSREIEHLSKRIEKAEDTAGDDLAEFKDDLRSDQNRMLALIGVGLAVFEFISKVLVK